MCSAWHASLYCYLLGIITNLYIIYLVKQHVYPTNAMPSAIGQYSPVFSTMEQFC